MDSKKLGKKFIVEVADTYLSAEEKRQLADLQPAGIMFRSKNFLRAAKYEDWLQEFDYLICDLRNLLGDKIILSIDHEGHKITRAPDPITRFPYASRWREDSAAVAKAMALELVSLGINLTFAPCLDIHSNSNNPVIAERAFGRTPEEVIKFSALFMAELDQHPLAYCGKHFPGHGDTSEDSHYQFPILNSSLAELKTRELVPFCSAIEQGLKCIMTSHLIFPKIDPDNIATFSEIFLNQILRQDLNFQGLIIADAFSMKPVLDSLSTPDSTIKAVNAGLDLLSVVGPHTDLSMAIKLRDFISNGLSGGQINVTQLESSISRIESYLAHLPVNQPTLLDAQTLDQHGDLAFNLWKKESWGNLKLNKHMITE